MIDLVVIPLLKTALLPLIAAMAVAWIFKKQAIAEGKDWVPALAIALGFALGCWALNGLATIRPSLSSQWLPYAAFSALVIFTIFPTDRKGMQILAAVLAGAAVIFIKLRLLPGGFDKSMNHVLMFAPLWLLLWFSWDVSLSDDDYPESLLLCVVAATAASLACALDGSVLIGQLAGALAAACGGLYLIKLKVKGLRLGPVFYGTFLAGFSAFLINAYVFVQGSWQGILLAYGAAFPALVTRLPFYKNLSPFKRTALMTAASLLFLIGTVVYLAFFKPEEYDPWA